MGLIQTTLEKAIAHNRALDERCFNRLAKRVRAGMPVATPLQLAMLAMYRRELRR